MREVPARRCTYPRLRFVGEYHLLRDIVDEHQGDRAQEGAVALERDIIALD